VPDDKEEEDTDQQKEIRMQMAEDSVGQDEDRFTAEELSAAVNCLKNRKAPGYDGIKNEVIRRVYGRMKGNLLDLYNKMLRDGEFPDVWKKGIVKVS